MARLTVTETTDRDEIEQAVVLAPGILLRGAELGIAVLVGLLVCPPLLILVVVVAVALLAGAIVAAVVAVPYLLARRVHEHHRTHGSSVVSHGLRRLRALRQTAS